MNDEDCKVILMLVFQVVGDFSVDDQAVLIILVLHYLDNLRIASFSNFFLFPL
jgi:hypothetical protein